MTTDSVPSPPERVIFPENGEVVSFRGNTYRIGREVGSGGFGRVYEVEDDWRNKLAGKLILPKGRTYEAVQDAVNAEFVRLVALRHPSVMFVYDAFEFKGGFYLILERCEGTVLDLFARVRDFNGRFWLPGIANSVLQALDFLHRANTVHKDVHCGNVFYSFLPDQMLPEKDALVFKLGDFGVSRTVDSINPESQFAQWMLAPECINPREFGSPGKQIDIYHAGLLLLSVLSGRQRAFSREEILFGVPRQIAAQLDHEAAGPISAALARHIANRPQSAKEFWKMLDQVGVFGSPASTV